MCKDGEELNNHILIINNKAHLLWDLFFSLNPSKQCRDLLPRWHRPRWQRVVERCGEWLQTEECNGRTFREKTCSSLLPNSFFLRTFWDWSQIPLRFDLSRLDFIDNGSQHIAFHFFSLSNFVYLPCTWASPPFLLVPFNT